MGRPGTGRSLAGRLIAAGRLLKSGKSGASAACPAESLLQVAGEHRTAEMEALELGAAQLPHDFRLGLRLDTLGGGFDTEPAGERQDRMDNGDAIPRAL